MALALSGIQQTAPSLQGIDAAPPQGLALQGPSIAPPAGQQSRDVWYGQDTGGAIIPWGEFNVGDYDVTNSLNRAYNDDTGANLVARAPDTSLTYKDQFGIARQGVRQTGSFGQSFVGAPQGIGRVYSRVPTGGGAKGYSTSASIPLTFKDENLNNAITALRDSASTPFVKGARPNLGRSPAVDKAMSMIGPRGGRGDMWGRVTFDGMNDPITRDAKLAEVAAKYGMTAEDLAFNYGKYDKAYRGYTDPVGGNWDDLMNSPNRDAMLAGIRKYSGQSDDFYKKTNLLAAAGPFGGASAEYFALHAPKIGVNQTTKSKRTTVHSDSDIRNHNPYLREEWTDYLQNNRPIWDQNPEEIAKAQADMALYKGLRGKTQDKGGVFDLRRESGYRPVHRRTKGGLQWQSSDEANRFDITQNALGSAGKSYLDAGLDPDKALRSSLYFKKGKPKKGFLGGFGKILGPIASIASMIPGPWQIPAMAYSAVSSIADKNYLGALASIAGMKIFPSGVAGASTSLASKAVSRLVESGLSVQAAGALVQGGLGAMRGAQSGNAGIGALTGGLSAFAPTAISNLTPTLGKVGATSLVNAGMGAVGGMGSGNAVLGAVLGGVSPLVSNAFGDTPSAQIGTGLTSRAIMLKAQLAKQKALMKKATQNRGVA